MLVNHDREKLLNLIIYFVTNTKKCFKTKLFKLLYFADFIHFRQTGRPITGLIYKTWGWGPVPSALHGEIKYPESTGDDLKKAIAIIGSEEKTQFKPRVKFDGKHFSLRERKIMEDLATIYLEADAKTMTEVTHLRNAPWDKTKQGKGMNQVIDYELAFDTHEDCVSYEEYQERVENDRLMKAFFR